MHIVSWNVASWPTALSLIVERHGSLGAFLAKHSIDVLALQEVKMQSQVIEHGLVPRPKTSEKREDLPLNVDGYESFWAPARAPPTAAGKVVTGFNGVATFASEGWTTHAERDPLRDALLDAEGRCVLTFHGDFAIFNVYIPYAGTGNERLTFKVRYLRALRDRMQKVRTDGYTVMLLGDLNVQRRLVDCHPNNRRVDVRRVLADGVAAAQTGGGEAVISEYVAAAAQLQLNWDQVKLMLGSRVAEKVTVRATHGSMERWKLFATACAPGAGSAPQRVQRGSPFQSEGEAMGEKGSDYRVDEHSVADEETGEVFIARAAETMRADQLQECLGKVGCVWSAAQLGAVVARAGSPGGAAVCRDWLCSLVDDDGMVDSFAALEPNAQGRYTCWSQYLNQ